MRLSTLAILFILPLRPAALAAVQVTNINQNDDGVYPADGSSAVALAFITGPGHTWRLNSVNLPVEYFGFGTTNIVVRLQAYLPGWGPGGTLEHLANYTLDQGPHNLMIISSGYVLQPSTRYYIVIDVSPSPLGVRVTEDNAECSVTGWTIEDYLNIQNFGFWVVGSTTSFRMSIDADPIIPAPMVTSVAGCTDAPPKTINCPNSGGVNLQVFGQNFTPQCVVLVGGRPATSLSYISSTQLNCVLPPGADRNQVVTVVNGTVTGLMSNGVSYAAPACPGDANGDGTVNFTDIGAVLAVFNAVCP